MLHESSQASQILGIHGWTRSAAVSMKLSFSHGLVQSIPIHNFPEPWLPFEMWRGYGSLQLQDRLQSFQEALLEDTPWRFPNKMTKTKDTIVDQDLAKKKILTPSVLDPEKKSQGWPSRWRKTGRNGVGRTRRRPLETKSRAYSFLMRVPAFAGSPRGKKTKSLFAMMHRAFMHHKFTIHEPLGKIQIPWHFCTSRRPAGQASGIRKRLGHRTNALESHKPTTHRCWSS